MYFAFPKFAFAFLAYLIPVGLFYLTIRRKIPTRSFKIFYWSVSLFFAVAFLIIRHFTPYIGSWKIQMPTTWLVWFYLLILVPFLVFAIFYWLDLLFNKIFGKNKCKLRYFVGLPLMAVFMFFYIQGMFNRFDLEVRHEVVEVENLPESFDALKIAVIGDTHLANLYRGGKCFDKLRQTINNEQVDLILFTGDLVNTTAIEANKYTKFFRTFNAKYGKYAVMGNHDFCGYYPFSNPLAQQTNIDGVKLDYQLMRFQLLDNDIVILEQDSLNQICIIGIDQTGNLKNIMENVPQNTFKILLTHDPQIWDRQIVGKEDIALTISGHTHALQCAFRAFGKKFSPASWFFEQWDGLYQKGNQQLFVTRGIGYVGIPSRIGLGPEVSFLTLKRK